METNKVRQKCVLSPVVQFCSLVQTNLWDSGGVGATLRICRSGQSHQLPHGHLQQTAAGGLGLWGEKSLWRREMRLMTNDVLLVCLVEQCYTAAAYWAATRWTLRSLVMTVPGYHHLAGLKYNWHSLSWITARTHYQNTSMAHLWLLSFLNKANYICVSL